MLKDQCLNATIFSVNKINVQHSRPKNILKCLEADRADPSRSEQVYRQLYLSDGLAKADHMFTTDVKGHSGCVNTLALSNQGEELMVSGMNLSFSLSLSSLSLSLSLSLPLSLSLNVNAMKDLWCSSTVWLLSTQIWMERSMVF